MVALVASCAGLYVWAWRHPVTIAGLRVAGQSLGDVPFTEVDARVAEAARAILAQPVRLRFGADSVSVPRSELGFVVATDAAVALVEHAGKSGDVVSDLAARLRARRGRLDLPLPVQLDRARALQYLTELKDDVDRAAVDARLDLEHHTVALERAGYLLRVYESMVALEYAAMAGATTTPREIVLSAGETAPKVTAADLKNIDISTVLGSWETRYSVSAIDSDRTYNLKVGADHLNGHILKPHEDFSFNQVVGDRTEKEGYRVAPVISGGELIDGLAGGMCQIASTLHAAAFFGALDIVSSTPHSRPSAYIPMGLDSTVVYPTTDLKLRNPYDFPVVMHYQVNQGSVKVELLGKERPYRVIFEREIKTETSFGSMGRHDPEAPSGQKLILQEGYPGYTLVRRRYVFAKDEVPKWQGPQLLSEILEKHRPGQKQIKPIKKEQWAIHYPATELIVATGSGSGRLKPKPAPPSHHIPPIAKEDKPIWKLLK